MPEIGMIDGARAVPVQRNPDGRGSLDVVFCDRWPGLPAMAQWNVVRSGAGTLRGLHAHSRYDEFYAPLSGRMFLVLKDARRRSPTFGAAASGWIDDAAGLFVPAGVAHGVYFETGSILAYGLSSPWTGQHEFNCRWNDPDVGAAWPVASATLSEKDADAGSFAAMVEALDADLP